MMKFNFSEAQRERLKLVEEMLMTIEALSPTDIRSCETGEIIEIDELARLRGILGGLADNLYWEEV